ncbi:hypothetical protein HDU93_002014 [Gonapodya sp. JEL0774]|nr:hypothetical protein HDU93_002014 [Gonapodya sp. JEL0774]
MSTSAYRGGTFGLSPPIAIPRSVFVDDNNRVRVLSWLKDSPSSPVKIVKAASSPRLGDPTGTSVDPDYSAFVFSSMHGTVADRYGPAATATAIEAPPYAPTAPPDLPAYTSDDPEIERRLQYEARLEAVRRAYTEDLEVFARLVEWQDQERDRVARLIRERKAMEAAHKRKGGAVTTWLKRRLSTH